MTWINSYSGVRVEPLAFTADMVRLTDIAHHLGNKARYTGAIGLTVAQHSIALAYSLPLTKVGRRKALMHDAVEAYWPDFPRPLKQDPRFPQWLLDQEKAIQAVIETALGIEASTAAEQALIDQYDVAICAVEARCHFGVLHPDWVFADLDKTIAAKMRNILMLLWSPTRAKKEFLRACADLGIG